MKHKKPKWWVWERPATVHIIYTGARAAVHPLKNEFGGCYGTLYGLFRNEMVKFFCDYSTMVKYGEKIVSNLMEKKYYDKKMERWRLLCKELNQMFKKLEETDLKRLPNEALYELYDAFDKRYGEWWGFGQVAENIGYYCEEVLKDALNDEHFKMHFNVLVTPTKPSFTNEEEHHLYKIAKEIQKNGFGSKKAKALLVEHANMFHWIENNYHETKALDESYFIEKVKALVEDKVNVDGLEANQKKRRIEVARKKNEIMGQLKFDERLRRIVEFIDEFAFFQDERKKYALIACRVLDLFTMEFSRRFKIDYRLMRWITPTMARELLRIGEVDVKRLEEIGNCTFVIFHEDGKDVLLHGKEALEKEKTIFSLDKSDVNEIEGISANQGRAEGFVRILFSPKEIKDMKTGEILVTTMTSPDFVPAMRKAAAIVTDEGGVTSHASIVSRELGIPCIIGTRIATKVLKDGMKVEVDANRGTVRILK